MSKDRDPWAWSREEHAAYTAQEQARDSSVPLDIIFKNLGHYDQGVVDERNIERAILKNLKNSK